MGEIGVARSFPSEARSLSAIRRFIAAEIERHSFVEFTDDLVLAATEACSNAIRHSGTSEIRVSIAPSGSCLEVTVTDDGIYRPLVPAPELDGVGHRGIHLMAAVVDTFSLRQGTPSHPGTTVSLVKCKW
jgi:anti-sigma regulatory factor (Ser/Thr protein kinase)